jgi:PE-PPE domain
VNYPASIGLLSGSLAAPGADDAIAMGRVSLHDQIINAVVNGNGDQVVVAGLSQGTMVINRELAYLATNPAAPRAGAVLFVTFSSPELGLAATYLPVGFTVPLINYTVRGLPDSQYDLNVVFGQYDAWANPPDRPWNPVAVANALFGALYQHNPPATAMPSDAVVVSRVTSELGGTTTTYMIPSPTLPLLRPLQQLGVPESIVSALNFRLKPIVDAGYSSLTPQAGPYFWRGQLRFPDAPRVPGVDEDQAASPTVVAANTMSVDTAVDLTPTSSATTQIPPTTSPATSRTHITEPLSTNPNTKASSNIDGSTVNNVESRLDANTARNGTATMPRIHPTDGNVGGTDRKLGETRKPGGPLTGKTENSRSSNSTGNSTDDRSKHHARQREQREAAPNAGHSVRAKARPASAQPLDRGKQHATSTH